MKSSEIFIKCLEAENVKYIFGIPGEENIEILKALTTSSIEFILTHDERGAAFMANTYGRLSGRPGVCISTLGPGATNLITGVADAFLDYSPMIAISGQIELSKIHKESHQYIDILSTFKPITKWSVRIETPDSIPEVVRKAFKLSSIEKPGPSFIEFPEDIASMETKVNPLSPEKIRYPEPAEDMLLQASSMIRESRFPIIIVGGGVNRGRATAELRRFISKTKIGTTTTFMGMGALPADDECFISIIGLQSNDYISCGLNKADLIIAIGYDPVEFDPKYWNPDGKKNIIHINFTPAEANSHYSAFELVGDIKNTLSLLADKINFSKDASYYYKLKLFAEHALHLSSKGFPLKPLRIIKEIRRILNRNDILISDVGAHKIWIARFYPAYEGNTVIISNGFASMGFGIPAAISAKLLYPNKNVIAIIGDGGFLMSMCEINTAVRLGLNFVCIIFNDGGYGLIEWKERLKYGSDFFVKFNSPDFVKLAEAFGAKGYKITSEDELYPAIKDALIQKVPSIIDCPVDYSENIKLTDKLGKIICPM